MGRSKRAVYIESLKKKIAIRRILSVLLVILAIAALGISVALTGKISHTDNSRALSLWRDSDYQSVYTLALKNLEKAPLSGFWLTMKGFSAFQLASAQVTAEETETFIDQAIFALRKALLDDKLNDPRVYYVLGKAYFLKGEFYADVSINYLEKARQMGYEPLDLAEFLGLSYSRTGDYQKSIEAFTRALGDYPSDLLLLALARNYTALDDTMNSSAYLLRCIDQTKDVDIKNQARIQLGVNYIKDGEWAAAQVVFSAVLSDDEQNAVAHYHMGEVFQGLGDSVKARSEWRKALRIDPSHAPSRERLKL